MREILFRGKRVDNGEWETGSLVYARMGTSEEQASIADKMTAYHTPVIPESIGQYTGVRDRNDTRIFEGDIISPGGETRLPVCWYDYGWHAKTEYGYESLERDWVNKHFKVIGNIHDNPELLNSV